MHNEVSAFRATGWNLFAHMRLVAHPTPSKELYATMMEACAHKDHPEPERGLDLWTEMTIDNAIQPDVNSFNAAMLAASSVKKTYLEAFRLMHQMLNFYHSALPGSVQQALYTPNRATFEALLKASRRAGDIARTRWILTEMIRFSNVRGLPDGGKEIAPLVGTLSDVFFTYSAAKASSKRGDLLFADQAAEGDKPQLRVVAPSTPAPNPDTPDASAGQITGQEMEAALLDGSAAAADVARQPPPPSSSSSSSFSTDTTSTSPSDPSRNVSNTPIPQTRREILHEARLLLSHAANDPQVYRASPERRSPTGALPALRHVVLSTSLLNSYLSVHYSHDDLAGSIEAFDTVFLTHWIERDAMSFLGVLDMCRNVDSDVKDRAAEEAFRIFRAWEAFEKQGERRILDKMVKEGPDVAYRLRSRLNLTPRVVEKIWRLMINIMAR